MKIKNILILILALVVSIIVVGMLLQLLSWALSLMWNLFVIFGILVLTFPIFVILKKKFFR